MPTTTLFVHRRSGDRAVHIGGRVASAEEAIRVVLEAPDGRVLVKSVARQRDGTFIGEVYGVKPNQRSVAIGDFVQFQESQILSFRTVDEPPRESVDTDMEEMVRNFEERFGEFEAQPGKQRTAPDSVTTANVSWPSTAKTEDQHVPARAPQPPVDVAPATARTGVDEVQQKVSVDKAPAALRASGKHTPPVPPERVTPSIVDRAPPAEAPAIVPAPEKHTPLPPSRLVEPPLVDRAPPAPVQSAAEDAPRCIECGTRLVIAPAREDTTPEPLKVSCRVCGRINKLAEAVRPTA